MAAPHVYLELESLTEEEARKFGIPSILRLDPHAKTKIGAPELGGKALSPYVSDSMCFITWQDGKLFVELSMQSKHGVRVNKSDLVIAEQRELFPHDKLFFAPIIKPGEMTSDSISRSGVWSHALMYKVVWETGFEFNCMTCSSNSKQTVIDPSHMTACPVCKKSGDQLLLKQVKKSLKRPLEDESDSPGY